VQKPRITFDRFGQVFFVFREVVRLAAKTNRKFLVLVLILNAIWGFSTAPGFYLEKLILDNLIASIGDPNWRQAMYLIGGIIFLRLLLELFRNVLSRVNGFLSRKMSQTFASELEIMMAKKMTELDIATIDDPDFKNKYTKIERESGRRAWGLMMPLSDISNYLIGMFAVVLSGIMQAWIAVSIKKFGHHLHPLSMNFIPMIIAGISMLLIAIFTEDLSTLKFNQNAYVSILYLAFFGSVVTFTSFYWLIKRVNLVILSLVAFITPIVALVLGYFFYNEVLSTKHFIGAALVLTGVFWANLGNLLKLRKGSIVKAEVE